MDALSRMTTWQTAMPDDALGSTASVQQVGALQRPYVVAAASGYLVVSEYVGRTSAWSTLDYAVHKRGKVDRLA